MHFSNYVNGFQTLRLVHVDSRYRGGYESVPGDQGFCEKTEIILYAEGFFHYEILSRGFSSSATAFVTGRKVQKGKWEWAYNEDDGAQLILNFEDMSELKMAVNYQGGKGLLLNGKRFTVERNCKTNKELHA